MKRFVWYAAFFLLAAPIFADEVGEITYLEDKATLVRGGHSLEVDFGTPVENLDFITTTKKGLAEIAIDPKTGIQGSIKIKPGSSMYLDLTSHKTEQKGGVELLAGSVALTVKKLSGKSDLEIRTQGTVMGVRGTVFDAATTAGGDLLVTCESGRVECRSDDGKTLFAEPGMAVEKIQDADFRNVPVRVSDLASFKKNWHLERIEAFKANAGKAIKFYSDRYLEMKKDFDEAYIDLLKRRNVLDKWFKEDARKTQGSKLDVMKEKKALMPPLMKLRKVTFLFERIYYRLLELEEYHREGYGGGPLGNGYTAEQFFRRFRNEAEDLREKMNLTRYSMKLFADRNEGSAPFDGLDEKSEAPDNAKTEEDKFFKK